MVSKVRIIDVASPLHEDVVKLGDAYAEKLLPLLRKIGATQIEHVGLALGKLNRAHMRKVLSMRKPTHSGSVYKAADGDDDEEADDKAKKDADEKQRQEDEAEFDAEMEDIADRIANDLDMRGFSILVDPTEKVLSAVARGTSGKVIAALGGPTAAALTGQLDQRSVDYAYERAAEMVGKKRVNGQLVDNPKASARIDESTRDMLRVKIADGLKDLKSSLEIQKSLEEDFGPVRAEFIAQTEVRTANSMGALNGFKKMADAGLNVKKRWDTAEDDRVDDEICEPNWAQGAIPLGQPFQSGHQTPAGHPRCRCRLSAVLPNSKRKS